MNDLDTMSIGMDGWEIKVPAAKKLIRAKCNIRSDFRIRVTEIYSKTDDEKVSITYEVKKGILPWAKKTNGGLAVTKSEFNATMNS